MKTRVSARNLSVIGVTALLSFVGAGPRAFGQAPIQLNPVLQSFGYFGTAYPSGAGYYGTYGGSYNYYQAGYPQSYYAPAYSPYPYSNPFYPSPSHGCSPRPSSFRPTTTFVPTELTRHPPSMANPWFTSPDTRERHGFSGR